MILNTILSGKSRSYFNMLLKGLIIFILSTSGSNAFSLEEESGIIVSLQAQGVKRISPDVVISISGLETGDDFTSKTIQHAIKKLYSSGFFENVEISKEKVGGGFSLMITVKESPVISKISFSGNKKFKTKKLMEICKLKKSSVGSESAIFEAETAIRQAYEKEGYYLVKITPTVTEKNGKVKIKFSINEGKRVKIKKIEIIGNQAFSDKKLRKQMKNKAKYWWPWSGKFNQVEFDDDGLRITSFYHSNGYPNCELVGTEAIPGETREWVTLQITINEGKKVYFGKVSFEGNEFLKTPDLKAKLKFKENTPYSNTKLTKTLEEIYGLYSDYGYLYLNIDPFETIDSTGSHNKSNITFKIREGKPARVNKIEIASNLSTHDNVIRRELTLFPGEIFSRKKLIVSQRKVFNLGFFKNITVDTRQANDSGDIDLILNIEEKPAGQASLGASYYPKYGIVGNIMLSTPNFRGVGEYIYINYEKGQKIQNMGLGYQKPWLFDLPISVGIGLYNNSESRYNSLGAFLYDLYKIGGNTKLGFPIPRLDFTKSYVSYTLEKLTLKGDEDNISQWYKDQKGIRSMIGFEVVRDSRDNYLNPTIGSRNVFDVEFSGGILGGDIDYHKETFETVTYHNLFWKFVLGLRGKFGLITPYVSGNSVPIFESFFLGGIGEWGLRGYRDYEIGPVVGGETIGGRFASLFTIEGKIAFDNNIYPLVFFDAGNSWPTFRETNFQCLKRSAGVGFRIEIPMMGLIGFDIGYGIDAVPRDWEFHLQMGRTF